MHFFWKKNYVVDASLTDDDVDENWQAPLFFFLTGTWNWGNKQSKQVSHILFFKACTVGKRTILGFVSHVNRLGPVWFRVQDLLFVFSFVRYAATRKNVA